MTMPAHNSKHLRLLPPHFAVGVVLVATTCLAQSFERHVSGVPFEYGGTPQTPRFELRTHFYHGLDVHNWFQFLDIDADGDFDLYHDNGASGMTLQRNLGTRAQAQLALAEATVKVLFMP